jgi:hypothetical protein
VGVLDERVLPVVDFAQLDSKKKTYKVGENCGTNCELCESGNSIGNHCTEGSTHDWLKKTFN